MKLPFRVKMRLTPRIIYSSFLIIALNFSSSNAASISPRNLADLGFGVEKTIPKDLEAVSSTTSPLEETDETIKAKVEELKSVTDKLIPVPNLDIHGDSSNRLKAKYGNPMVSDSFTRNYSVTFSTNSDEIKTTLNTNGTEITDKNSEILNQSQEENVTSRVILKPLPFSNVSSQSLKVLEIIDDIPLRKSPDGITTQYAEELIEMLKNDETKRVAPSVTLGSSDKIRSTGIPNGEASSKRESLNTSKAIMTVDIKEEDENKSKNHASVDTFTPSSILRSEEEIDKIPAVNIPSVLITKYETNIPEKEDVIKLNIPETTTDTPIPSITLRTEDNKYKISPKKVQSSLKSTDIGVAVEKNHELPTALPKTKIIDHIEINLKQDEIPSNTPISLVSTHTLPEILEKVDNIPSKSYPTKSELLASTTKTEETTSSPLPTVIKTHPKEILKLEESIGKTILQAVTSKSTNEDPTLIEKKRNKAYNIPASADTRNPTYVYRSKENTKKFVPINTPHDKSNENQADNIPHNKINKADNIPHNKKNKADNNPESMDTRNPNYLYGSKEKTKKLVPINTPLDKSNENSMPVKVTRKETEGSHVESSVKSFDQHSSFLTTPLYKQSPSLVTPLDKKSSSLVTPLNQHSSTVETPIDQHTSTLETPVDQHSSSLATHLDHHALVDPLDEKASLTTPLDKMSSSSATPFDQHSSSSVAPLGKNLSSFATHLDPHSPILTSPLNQKSSLTTSPYPHSSSSVATINEISPSSAAPFNQHPSSSVVLLNEKPPSFETPFSQHSPSLVESLHENSSPATHPNHHSPSLVAYSVEKSPSPATYKDHHSPSLLASIDEKSSSKATHQDQHSPSTSKPALLDEKSSSFSTPFSQHSPSLVASLHEKSSAPTTLPDQHSSHPVDQKFSLANSHDQHSPSLEAPLDKTSSSSATHLKQHSSPLLASLNQGSGPSVTPIHEDLISERDQEMYEILQTTINPSHTNMNLETIDQDQNASTSRTIIPMCITHVPDLINTSTEKPIKRTYSLSDHPKQTDSKKYNVFSVMHNTPKSFSRMQKKHETQSDGSTKLRNPRPSNSFFGIIAYPKIRHDGLNMNFEENIKKENVEESIFPGDIIRLKREVSPPNIAEENILSHISLDLNVTVLNSTGNLKLKGRIVQKDGYAGLAIDGMNITELEKTPDTLIIGKDNLPEYKGQNSFIKFWGNGSENSVHDYKSSKFYSGPNLLFTHIMIFSRKDLVA